ncbi:MAG: hypothetical protein EBZ78_02005 [Verrucomicrobia bacterium]|nr:hypothetical protein [Verrucomicrobiota bacterium]
MKAPDLSKEAKGGLGWGIELVLEPGAMTPERSGFGSALSIPGIFAGASTDGRSRAFASAPMPWVSPRPFEARTKANRSTYLRFFVIFVYFKSQRVLVNLAPA